MEGQRAAALFWLEGDAQPQESAEIALECHRVGVTQAPRRARHFRAALDTPLLGGRCTVAHGTDFAID
jgi:hypothetical protein